MRISYFVLIALFFVSGPLVLPREARAQDHYIAQMRAQARELRDIAAVEKDAQIKRYLLDSAGFIDCLIRAVERETEPNCRVPLAPDGYEGPGAARAVPQYDDVVENVRKADQLQAKRRSEAQNDVGAGVDALFAVEARRPEETNSTLNGVTSHPVGGSKGDLHEIPISLQALQFNVKVQPRAIWVSDFRGKLHKVTARIENTTGRKVQVTLYPEFTCAGGIKVKSGPAEFNMAIGGTKTGDMQGLYWYPCGHGIAVTDMWFGKHVQVIE